MAVPQCVDAQGEGPAHGATRWHVVVIIVTITVIVLACADVSPEWLSGAAAMIGVLVKETQHSS